MKKIGLLIFIAAIVIGVGLANVISFGKFTGKIFSFSINSNVIGSGETATERRDLTEFNAIEVSGVFEVEALAGKDYSVEVEADDNLLPLIKTEMHGGVLRLTTEKSIASKNPIRVRVTAPNIENLEASGASKVSIGNISNENLEIRASGASKVMIAGETVDLALDISGASKVDAENLKSENVLVDASGASHASVSVVKEMKAEASGASSILYAGSPQNLTKKTSGASSIRQK